MDKTVRSVVTREVDVWYHQQSETINKVAGDAAITNKVRTSGHGPRAMSPDSVRTLQYGMVQNVQISTGRQSGRGSRYIIFFTPTHILV